MIYVLIIARGRRKCRVNIEADGVEIKLRPKAKSDEDFDANLAEYIDENVMQSLASDLVEEFEKDMRDRKEWIQAYIEGLKLLGLRYENRTEPWAGAE